MPTLLSPALETASLPFNSWYYVEVVTHLPPIGVFLLSFSRFISVYFPKFYIKNAKTWAALLFIFVINYLYITTIFIVSRNRDAVNKAIYEENELFDGNGNGSPFK
uniref:Uncharacterized protein n=1 Tax=Panagrolaimus davidi TaxID=227884 RepID=A0A914QHE0_9BILA